MKSESFKIAVKYCTKFGRCTDRSVLQVRMGHGSQTLLQGLRQKACWLLQSTENTLQGTRLIFSRYNLEQIKGRSDRFRSKFACKNSDYYWMAWEEKLPLEVCVHTCDNTLQKLTESGKFQRVSLPLCTVGVSAFYFPILLRSLLCEKPIRLRSFKDLASRSWGSEEETQKEGWVGEEHTSISMPRVLGGSGEEEFVSSTCSSFGRKAKEKLKTLAEQWSFPWTLP